MTENGKDGRTKEHPTALQQPVRTDHLRGRTLFEKYRPRKLDELVGNADVVAELRVIVQTGSLPQAMIFHGIPGVGKTSAAQCLIREYLANHLRQSRVAGDGDAGEIPEFVLKAYCLSIDPIRMRNNSAVYVADEIMDYLRTAGLLDSSIKKVVLFDDIATLDRKTQHTLLRPIEHYSDGNCSVFIDNDPKNLIPALRNRAAGAEFEFKPVSPDEMSPLLNRIVTEEKMQFPEPKKVIQQVAESSQGSVRSAIGLLDQAWRRVRGQQVKGP